MSTVIEQSIEVSEDGKVTRTGDAPDVRETKLDLIAEKIEDPNFDPAEISRWIAIEIASVAREMVGQQYDPTEQWKLKAFSEQIKALRELGKQLNDTDLLNKKDILNFDGAKFQFVISEFVELFLESMREAGIEEDMRKSVMKHYRDILAQAEARIRRDTAKIEGKR
jgi:hypothetical protein